MTAPLPPRAPAVAPGEAVAPLALRLATTIVVLQTVGEAVGIGWREDLRWPLRIALILVISAQVVFARWARRLSPGSVFALFAYQITAVLVAVGGRAPVPLRGLLGASAVAVGALLVASLPAFPEPDLPLHPRGPR